MQAVHIEKYLRDDTVFNLINKEFVSLKDADIKENNAYLQQFLNMLIAEMKEADPTFGIVNPTISYAGSYYKQTKYGKPEEFDLNIIIKLPPPINYNSIKITNCRPGFVKIHSGLQLSDIQNNSNANRFFRSILDDGMYINQKKFRQWMEGVLANTRRNILNKREQCIPSDRKFSFAFPFYRVESFEPSKTGFVIAGSCLTTYRKGGPAFTLSVAKSNGQIVSVDLVPVLQFTNMLKHPQQSLARYNCKDWYAVPKPLYANGVETNTREWRLCFYNQEKEILRKNGPIKPVIRQLKKLRDTQEWHKICSYFIEIVSLNYLKAHSQRDLQTIPRTLMFFQLLKSLHLTLEKHTLPWFWDNKLNLIEQIQPSQLTSIKFRLCKIIKSIEEGIMEDKLIMAKYILYDEEMSLIRLPITPPVITAPPNTKNGREEASYCTIV